MNKNFNITDKIAVGANNPLLLIAGPCQIESEDHAFMIAKELKEITKEHDVNLVFKASYDKANRTSLEGKRGVGITDGLEILKKINKDLGLPVITDVHSAEQAKIAGSFVDIIQVPSFLCRQTDLLIECGKTNKTINLKKGQFLHPADLKYAAEKIASTGNNKILLCERGTCFGYRDLVVDFRNFEIMKNIGYPVVFDATHSVQQMGGAGGKSSGNREYVAMLAKAAITCGINGLFIETHNDPDNAPSDGANMLYLNELSSLLVDICKIRQTI